MPLVDEESGKQAPVLGVFGRKRIKLEFDE
jgi:hypothetical protein